MSDPIQEDGPKIIFSKTPEELERERRLEKSPIRLMAEIIVGMRVPHSIATSAGVEKVHFGTASEPYLELCRKLNLFGYPTVEEVEKRLREEIGKQISTFL